MAISDPKLIDPLSLTSVAPDCQQSVVHHYVSAINQMAYRPPLIGNLKARYLYLKYQDFCLPISVNEAQGDTSADRNYVTNPLIQYGDYAIMEAQRYEYPYKSLCLWGLKSMRAALKAAQFDRAVSVDNWLISTNLHGGWQGELLREITDFLIATYPEHYLVVRSVDPWSHPKLYEALIKSGWVMVPSRQIWVSDDLETQWRSKRSTKNDFKHFKASGLRIEDCLDPLDDETAIRIAKLYRDLYIEKYSHHNPYYEPAYHQFCHDHKIIHYRLLKDNDQTILAVAGLWREGQIVTTPILGYDLSLPQSLGLYRLGSLMAYEWAAQHGLRMHNSGGAAHFKSSRGAEPIIEYCAFYPHHLKGFRGVMPTILKTALDALAVPIMKAKGF